MPPIFRHDREAHAAQKEILLSTLALIDEPVMDRWDDESFLWQAE